jgi:drug/metabolite transporter (DMT)-like permease
VKTVVVVTLAALSAAVGETLLSFGMKKHGAMNLADPSQWFSLILSVARNPYVTLGVAFLAIFFFLYLAALSWADLSFVLPLTAVSYIFAALLARFVLRVFRWIGTAVIMIGITLIALNGGQHPRTDKPSLHQSDKNVESTGAAERSL